jgi:hypothetical protein
MLRCVSFDITSVRGCSHIGIARQYIIVIYWLWRAGAEQESDEENCHYAITLASVFIRVVTLESSEERVRLFPIE